MSRSTADQDDQHGRPGPISLGTSSNKLYVINIVVISFLKCLKTMKQELQIGSTSPLDTTPNDDFARDILNKNGTYDNIVLQNVFLASSWNRGRKGLKTVLASLLKMAISLGASSKNRCV